MFYQLQKLLVQNWKYMNYQLNLKSNLMGKFIHKFLNIYKNQQDILHKMFSILYILLHPIYNLINIIMHIYHYTHVLDYYLNMLYKMLERYIIHRDCYNQHIIGLRKQQLLVLYCQQKILLGTLQHNLYYELWNQLSIMSHIIF